MVKRRNPPSQSDVEKFADGADQAASALDKNAKRDFKAIKLPLNEYEYRQLEKLALETGRSKLNALRWAVNSALNDLEK